MQGKIIGILVLVLGSSYILPAQRYVDAQLIQPIESAIDVSYSLKNKNAAAEKAAYELKEVQAKQKPSVTANALYAFLYNEGNMTTAPVTLSGTGVPVFPGLDQGFSNIGNVATAGVTAKQVIFAGLQITNAIKALEAKKEALNYLAGAGKEDIALDVITTFDQLILLNEVEKLIDDSQRRLLKEDEYVSVAITNGLAIPFDRDKIRLAQLELEARQTELKGNRSLLLQKLETVTRLPEDNIKKVLYTLEPIWILQTPEKVENRAELKALESSVKAHEYLYKKEKGGAMPAVFAIGGISYVNLFGFKPELKGTSGVLPGVDLKLNSLRLFPNTFIGVGIKMEIYGGGSHKNKLKQAQLDIEMSKNKLAETGENLQLLLAKNKTAYATANALVTVKTQQMKVARNNNVAASRQYREGLISITDWLAAENELFSSSLGYYMQVIQQRKNALDILHTSGDLLSVLKNNK